MSKLVIDDPSSSVQLSEETSYRGISNYSKNNMVLKTNAMKQLRTHLSFTQLRFHCNKQQGRTFHVTTAANRSGEAVVQYFSGQTRVQPSSCNSFLRMEDDNSKLSAQCEKWGYDGEENAGKWGHYNSRGPNRLYNRMAFIYNERYWRFYNGRQRCDDGGSDISPISAGDFWKIYVR